MYAIMHHNGLQNACRMQDKLGYHSELFLLGLPGNLGKFSMEVNTTSGIRSAFDAASGIEFPSSAAK